MRLILICFSIGLLGSAVLYGATPRVYGTGLYIAGMCLIILACTKFRLAILIAFFIIGSLLGILSAFSRMNALLPPELVGVDSNLTGCIVGFPQIKERYQSFYLSDLIVNQQKMPGKVKLNWYSSDNWLKPGQCWQLSVRLKRPHSFSSPSVPDFELFMLRQDIIATGYVRNEQGSQLLSDTELSLDYLRWRIAQWIKKYSKPDVAGILSALLVGDKQSISQEQWRVFNTMGVTHLLVISGLHIGFIAWFGYLMAGLLVRTGLWSPLWCPLPKFGAALGLISAFLYALLAGFSVPVQRALVMLSAGLCGILIDRRMHPSTLWLTAFAAVLVIDPLSGFSNGFWLSFLAVAGLIYGLSAQAESSAGSRTHLLAVVPAGFWHRKVLPSIKAQWVVTCMLWPCLAMALQPINLFSILVNLLSIPLITLIVVPGLMLSALLSLFHTCAGAFLLSVCAWLLHYWYALLIQLEGNKLLSFQLPGPGLTALFCALAGAVCLLSPKALGLRWLSVPCCLPWWLGMKNIVPDSQVEVALLDTGKGMAVVIHTAHHNMLIESGTVFSHHAYNPLDSVVLPYAKSKRVNFLDKAVIAGERAADNLIPLAGRFSVGTIYLPEPLNDQVLYPVYRDKKLAYCQSGDSWNWDGVVFRFLVVPSYDSEIDTISGNTAESAHKSVRKILQVEQRVNRSCILQVEAGNKRFLFIPALSVSAEKYLAKHMAESLHSDVLIAGGNSVVLSEHFLQKIHPRYLLLSSHYRYRFQFPSQTLRQRFNRFSTKVLITYQDGTIQCSSAQSLLCEGYRKQRYVYWPEMMTWTQ